MAKSPPDSGEQPMGMRDGVSQCWWLSKNCVVNWDAWSAVGTLLAVCVAITISLVDAKRRRQDQESRAMWLRLELIQPMSDWQSNLFRFCKSLERKRYFAVVEALRESDESTRPLQEPQALKISSARLHELGIGAKPLAEAMRIARELEDVSWMYIEVFLDLQDRSAADVREMNLRSADELLETSRALHTHVVLALEELRRPFKPELGRLARLRKLITGLGRN
ncbi:hypothetical protein LL963_16230 [Xanthomonas campestris pv. esculenti]|nr:hypothetical protein [Xanthomonas campestris pv. esculenti]